MGRIALLPLYIRLWFRQFLGIRDMRRSRLEYEIAQRRAPSLKVVDAIPGVDWGKAFFENAGRE